MSAASLLRALVALPLFAAALGAQADTTVRAAPPAVVAQPAGAVRATSADSARRPSLPAVEELHPGRTLAKDVVAISLGTALVGAIAGATFNDACFVGNGDGMAARGFVAGALVGVPASYALRRSHRRPEARRWISRVPDALKAATVFGLVSAAAGMPMGVVAGSADSGCDRNVGDATLRGIGQMGAAGVVTGLAANLILFL
jgi:hypothetical protein